VKYDVIVYAGDPAGAFAPALNASKPTGGTEIHAVQLCEGLAAAGFKVMGMSYVPAESHGAIYCALPSPDERIECRALITIGLTPPPATIVPDRHVVLWTHDPPHNAAPLEAAGLRWSSFVCVSQWQANRFPRGWRRTVIPPIIDDWIYDLPQVERDPNKFVCVSAAWKGATQTLHLWTQMRQPGMTLHIGSPYSHDAGFRAMVERTPQTKYLELDSPRAVVEAMRGAAGSFRMCVNPETYGISDVIMQILGGRTHVYCPSDMGGLAESLMPNPWATNDFAKFEHEFYAAHRSPPKEGFAISGRNLRSETIVPLWQRILGL
jgi:hypothetical protein